MSEEERSSRRHRAIFFGTPELAVPSLSALASVCDVRLVLTQPDKPKGRGLALHAPPVKELALSLGIEVLQPVKVRTPELAETLRRVEADVAVVVAYGRILPKALLEAPRLGCLNVHASLLPRWRGAAPIQWAIAHGDRETGVCLMKMDEGLDTGPVLACDRTPIDPDETAGELGVRLSKMGASLVERELPRYLAGALVETAQDGTRATVAPLLRKEDGELDFTASAQAVHDRARGMSPWPSASTRLGAIRIKVLKTRVVQDDGAVAEPGTIVAISPSGLEVACERGIVALVELRPEGKRSMSATELAAGHRVEKGARLGP